MANEVKTEVGMGCYVHPEERVVATCKNCGKFMCRECAEKYESKLCEECEKLRITREQQQQENKKVQAKVAAKDYKNETVKGLVKVALISGILGIIGFCMGSSEGIGNGITFAWLLAGFPWGWKIINKIMDGNLMTWFIILTEKFWIVAYVIKFALAFMIGAFVWPFKLGISIYRVVSAKKIENNANQL